jgi:ABC-2 type transport system permease protein
VSSIISTENASSTEVFVKLVKFDRALSFTSPMKLYTDATASIVDPMRRTLRPYIVQMGIIKQWSMSRFSGPLPLLQSFLMVVPYIIYLIAITIICFAISYIVFMRQEVRSI